MSLRCISAAAALAFACSAGALAEQTADEARVEAALSGFERTGELRSCLNTRTIRSIDPIDETHWLVETRSGETYLNVVNGSCNDADSRFSVLEYSLSSSQLCQNAIVRVVDRSGGFVRGSCSLGEYERLTPIE